ncbi:hypothetical protein [Halomontanus rarus]|uniref:hypothetical protein n=1 Tax=Halomontanus rarus TaxID=3034020 RepID=UPI0023E84133|nr:hypothetical protein [Halovivax sp. TS33]
MSDEFLSLERQADEMERQADALETIANELRFQNAALVEIAWRLHHLECGIDPHASEHTMSHRAFMTGLDDHDFERREREEDSNAREIAGGNR